MKSWKNTRTNRVVKMAKPENKLKLTITTPRGVKFVEEADMIVMRAVDGELGVLPGHAPLTTVLGDGVLRITNNGVQKKQLAVFGGVAEIGSNRVDIFTTIAQSPEEIDLERAETDRLETEDAMREQSEEHMTRRLQVMQTRALVRIHVSQSDYFDDIEDDE